MIYGVFYSVDQIQSSLRYIAKRWTGEQITIMPLKPLSLHVHKHRTADLEVTLFFSLHLRDSRESGFARLQRQK